MKRLNKIFLSGLFLAFCMALFTTCKKYPEDENIQLRTVRKRISQTWILNKLYVDGVDSTDILLSFFKISSPSDLVLDSPKSKIGQTRSEFACYVNGELYYLHAYEFRDKKNKFRLESSRFLFRSSGFYTAEWVIKKLTMKHFTFECTYNNKLYRYEFKN